MVAKRSTKLSKQLLRNLHSNGVNNVYARRQFNDSLTLQIPTKKYLDRHILCELHFYFNIIAGKENRIYNDNLYFNSNMPDYNFEFASTPLSAGGVGVYVDATLNYTVIERTSNKAFQALWVELQFAMQSNVICRVFYRQYNFAERTLF